MRSAAGLVSLLAVTLAVVLLPCSAAAEDPGSTNGEVITVLEAVAKARDAPPQNFALSVPGFTGNGGDYRLDCLIGVFRNSDDFDPRKGVKGRLSADVLVCDGGEAPITCTGGFRVFDMKFKTDLGGFAAIGQNIPAEQLGSLLDGQPPTAYPAVIVTSRFTNRKSVAAYNLGCHFGPAPT